MGWLGRGHRGVIIGEPNLLGPLPASLDAVSAEDTRLTHHVPDVDEVAETVEQLYVRLAPELIRFATSLVGPSQAEDLLGSTVAKAIASTQWDRIDNKRAYVERSCENCGRVLGDRGHLVTTRSAVVVLVLVQT